MQYATCPECKWTLGVPAKLVDQPVSCPKCAKTFLAGEDNLTDEKPEKKKRKPAAKSNRPKPRGLPMPAAIKKKNPPSPSNVEQQTKPKRLKPEPEPNAKSESITSAEFQSTISDLAPPPPRKNKESKSKKRSPKRKTAAADAPVAPADTASLDPPKAIPPAAPPVAKSIASEPPETKPVASKPPKAKQRKAKTPETEPPETDSPEADPAPSTTALARPPAEQSPVGTAKIITTVPDDSDFAKNGKLPSLQLKDDEKPTIKTEEIKRNPVFLGLLVCFSLLLSGSMLFFIDLGEPENTQSMEDIRVKLQKFYETRFDVQLKPYQLELREAQLAHSRDDRESEIEELRKVMARFRAEDRNKFVGVTGSPTADQELEQLVSALLGDGELHKTN